MVEVDVVERKLKQLNAYLGNLEKYRGISPEELAGGLDKAWAVEHGLQLCIQIVLDIGNHILAEEGIVVDEFGDIFEELVRLGVIPEDFHKKVKGMAGFRNILVHEYGKVDLKKVASAVNESLGDFRMFSEYIIKYLDKFED